jgi:cell division septum initiation protein DivIVA
MHSAFSDVANRYSYSEGAEMTLIERLRKAGYDPKINVYALLPEAADAIEALQAENERLKEKLESWKDECHRVQALFEKETLRASELHESRDALAAKLVPLTECAKRLLDHAEFQLGGILSADSKAKDIPSRAVSQVKSRHLAALRDLVAIDAAKGGQHEDS